MTVENVYQGNEDARPKKKKGMSMRDLGHLPNPLGSHRADLRGGAAAARLIATLMPEVVTQVCVCIYTYM